MALVLPGQPQSEADSPLAHVRVVVFVGGAGDGHETASTCVAGGVREVRCIAEIESLGAELQLEPLGNAESAKDTEVHVGHARSPKDVPAGGAKASFRHG